MASSPVTPSSLPLVSKKDVDFSASCCRATSLPLSPAPAFKKRPSIKIFSVMTPQRQPSTTGVVKSGMTMTEKILGRASEKRQISPGENVWVNVDTLMTHDVCGPAAFAVFKREFGDNAKVWDREKVVVIPDHYIFTADERANRNVDTLRDFCTEQNIKYFYDIKDLSDFKANPDYKGVCHVALAQEGHCRPGEVLLGTDSHTCTAGAFGQFATGIGITDAGFVLGTGKLLLKVPPTLKFVMDGEMPNYLLAKDLILQIIGEISVAGATYKAMEFVGSTVESLTMEERMTLCNMVIEAGGKNGVVPADSTTYQYLQDKTSVPYEPVYSDGHARHPEATVPLPWSTRMMIALGAAKGLAFLHNAERPVIYRDFKTSNILLDSDYIAKLSDFGLAKAGPQGDETHVSTRVMGTYGYAAPEYVMTGHLTARSDVYSFGVVLLELLTGRKSVDKTRPSKEQSLVDWARPKLNDKRKMLQIIDPRLESQYSVRAAQKACSLAYYCLSQNPKARPLMSDVVETLEPLQCNSSNEVSSSSSSGPTLLCSGSPFVTGRIPDYRMHRRYGGPVGTGVGCRSTNPSCSPGGPATCRVR